MSLPDSNWVQFPGMGMGMDVGRRLFCFPCAGAGASVFHAWPRVISKNIDICSVQLPGRENRLQEPVYTDCAALIPVLSEALLPYLDLPYAFFGHSLGGLLAFACARYLYQRYGTLPTHLFVAATAAPHLPQRRLSHLLSDSAVVDQPFLRQYSGFASDMLYEPELMAMFLPVLRADYALFESYRYQENAPLPCPITVYGGWQDGLVSYYDLLAWKKQTSSTFAVRMFAGDHFFLRAMRSSLVQSLSEQFMPVAAL